MGKPHPVELLERVVAFVEEGHSHRSAAERFRVSPRFVNNTVRLSPDQCHVAMGWHPYEPQEVEAPLC